MLILKSKFLEARELPAQEPYPPSLLVSVLAGTDTLHLIANREVASALEGVEPFADLRLELRWRRVDLAALGGTGKGKAYRLSVVRVLDSKEAL